MQGCNIQKCLKQNYNLATFFGLMGSPCTKMGRESGQKMFVALRKSRGAGQADNGGENATSRRDRKGIS